MSFFIPALFFIGTIFSVLSISSLKEGVSLFTVLQALSFLITFLIWVKSRIVSHSSSKSSLTRSLAAIFSLLVLSLFHFGFKGSGFNRQWDLSALSVNTLSTKTVTLLKELDQASVPITIHAFIGEDLGGSKHRILKAFAQASSNITLHLAEKMGNAQQMRELGADQERPVVLEVQAPQRRLVRLGLFSEERHIANAVHRLLKQKQRVLYVSAGHGERLLTGLQASSLTAFSEMLTMDGVSMKPLILSSVSMIPADADGVMVAAPSEQLLEQEVEILREYINQGGSLFLLADQATSDPHPLSSLFSAVDIQISSIPVIDSDESLPGSNGLQQYVRRFARHPITDLVASAQRAVVMQGALALAPTVKGLNGLPFALSSKAAYAKDTKAKGPFALGYVLERALTELKELPVEARAQLGDNTNPSTAKLVVMGDIDWLSNSMIKYYGNADLALQTVRWLLDPKDLGSFTPDTVQYVRAPISNGALRWLVITSICVAQLLCLIGFVRFRRS